jgi:hypothetical protein
MRKQKNLIIVRAGDESLHPYWLGSNQNFDIIVSYFGNDPLIYKDNCQRIDYKGSKWQGLHLTINDSLVNWKEYDYICFPDDDLYTTSDNLNLYFDIVHELQPLLSQPALTSDSFFSHKNLLQVPNTKYRKTNFVEVMIPCFRKDFLFKARHTFAENVSGWGLDYLWSSMINHQTEDMIIVDQTPVKHTRPVGKAGNGTGSQNIDPSLELKSLRKKFLI